MRDRFPYPLCLAFLLCALTPVAGRGAVVINELLPDPTGSDDGNELVEIYNAGPGAVDLTGWCIEDAATINDGTVRRRIPEDFDAAFGTSPVLNAGDFRVVRGAGVAYLNNSSDTVYLNSNRTGNLAAVVYTVNYPSVTGHTGESWANIPDAATPPNFAWRASTFGSSNCASDIIPPAAITTLVAAAGTYAGEVNLSWTAVGNDGVTGTASQYTVKYNTVPVTAGNFAGSADAFNEPAPAVSGSQQSMTVFGLATGTTYYFAIKALDCQNASALSNVPSSIPGTSPLPFLDRTAGLQVYYGNLHSHTSYSDGVDQPATAYNFARNLAPTPLDFLAITDHNHASAGPMTPALYQQGLAAAAQATQDGAFVAIYGQEWGLADNGHVNIFEAPVLFGWDAGRFDVFVAEGDYPGLYTAVAGNPSPWGPIAAIAHPNAGDCGDFVFTPAGGTVIAAMATINGPALSAVTNESDVGNTNFDAQIGTAIQHGYFLSFTGDQDNHLATWGASTQSRTAILATELTKAALLSGLAGHQTYATQDHNAQVGLKVNGWPMGSQLTAAVGAGVNFDVLVTDADGEHVALFELYRGVRGSSAPVVVATAENVDHFVYRDTETPAPADGDDRLYYLRITQADNHRIWVAPVEVTFGTVSDVATSPPAPVLGGTLYPAQPNPFNPVTDLRFALTGDGRRAVKIAVFDVSGRSVRTLVDERLDQGEHQARWDGRDGTGQPVASGVYLARLIAPGVMETRRLVLVR